MTTTRINHTGHNHPNTTAARTACRKALKATATKATLPLAKVGKGNAQHWAELWDGKLSSVRCGAGLGRGVKKNSPLIRLEDGTIDDVTCTKCKSFYGIAHN
jgi:hypothetical protein